MGFWNLSCLYGYCQRRAKNRIYRRVCNRHTNLQHGWLSLRKTWGKKHKRQTLRMTQLLVFDLSIGLGSRFHSFVYADGSIFVIVKFFSLLFSSGVGVFNGGGIRHALVIALTLIPVVAWIYPVTMAYDTLDWLPESSPVTRLVTTAGVIVGGVMLASATQSICLLLTNGLWRYRIDSRCVNGRDRMWAQTERKTNERSRRMKTIHVVLLAIPLLSATAGLAGCVEQTIKPLSTKLEVCEMINALTKRITGELLLHQSCWHKRNRSSSI